MERSDPGIGGAGSVVWPPDGSSQGPGGNINWHCAATQVVVLSRELGTLGGFISLPGWPCQDAGEGEEGCMAGQVLGVGRMLVLVVWITLH